MSYNCGCNNHSGTELPQGPTGNTGATGPQGPRGYRGFQGNTGAAGTNGTNGVDGADGADGADGYVGPAYVLAPWMRALTETPATAKIALVGDSTYDVAAAGAGLHNGFKAQIGPGASLAGMVDANILNFGYNGQTTAQITSDAHMSALTAAAPNLVIAGPGINDIRATALTTAQLRAILVTGFNKIRAAVPGVPIIASIPNSFLTTDVGSTGYVVPNGDAQAKSTILRDAYLSLIDEWPDVLVHDTQEEVFGKTSLATSPFMSDQIHPTTAGFYAKVTALIKLVGRTIPFSTGRVAAARVASPYTPWTVYGREVEDTERYTLVASGTYNASGVGGSDYLDIAYPFATSKNIQAFDIVELPDGTSFVLNNVGLSIVTNGGNTRITITGGTLPAHTSVAGRGLVKIWRRTGAVEAAVDAVVRDTSWRYKRTGRFTSPSGTNTYLDIGAASVSGTVNTIPASEWALQAGDKVYIDGDAANVFTIGTNATAGSNGTNLRLTGVASADRTALLGRLVVAVGTHA